MAEDPRALGQAPLGAEAVGGVYPAEGATPGTLVPAIIASAEAWHPIKFKPAPLTSDQRWTQQLLANVALAPVAEEDRQLVVGAYANVTEDQPQPVIWWAEPNYGREGWEFELVGRGFATTPSWNTVDLGGVDAPVIAAERVLDSRTMTPGEVWLEQFESALVEHERVKATVPAGLEPGGKALKICVEIDPDPPLPANLSFDLRAEDAVVTDGVVTAWEPRVDDFATTTVISGTEMPTRNDADPDFAGRSTIRFSSSTVTRFSWQGFGLGPTDPLEVWVLALIDANSQVEAGDGPYVPYLWAGPALTNPSQLWYPTYTERWFFSMWRPDGTRVDSIPEINMQIPWPNPRALSFASNGAGSWWGQKNGTTVVSSGASTGGFRGLGSLMLQSSSEKWSGGVYRVAEAKVWNRVLSAAERTQVVDYFSAKYGPLF